MRKKVVGVGEGVGVSTIKKITTVYVRRIDPSVLAFSVSFYRLTPTELIYVFP